MALLALSLVPAAWAAPTISRWSVDSDGMNESITLRWDEEGSFEINRFEDARQLVIVLPGATLGENAPASLDLAKSRLFKRARLQPVTLPSGGKGVQITLDLHRWANIDTKASGKSLVLTAPVPSDLLEEDAPKAAAPRAFEFTDEKIKELDSKLFGGSSAPSTGAGQVPAEPGTVNEFYVPEAGRNDQPGLSATAQDKLGEMVVQTKLNDTVRRVDFQGTSLENVLRLIAEEAQLNVLMDPAQVSGKTVTLRLRDVTLRQMLDAILKANGLGYTVEPGGIINIVDRSVVTTEKIETVTQTVAINWVDARDVKTAVEPFVSDEGAVEVSGASNTVIVRDIPENVSRIQDLINQIDVPEKQVLMELRLVNMTETARRSFGTRTNWQSQDTQNRFLPGANGVVGTNAISSGSTSTNGFNNSVTGSVTNSTNSSDNGISRLFSTNGATSNGSTSGSTSSVTNTASQALTQTQSIIPTSIGSAGVLASNADAFNISQLTTLQIFGNDYDVNLALNAEEARGEAVTLANPSVLSLNNVEAKVEIKRFIPYSTAINSDQGSVATVEFKDVGTEVTLLPRITNNGYVQMRIAPEQIIDTGDRPGGVPVTDERRVNASVIVKDEQTVALGGLRSFDANSGEEGIPYLLRLPVFSWLFKAQNNTQTKTELYLFVTPHIIKDPTPTAYQQALYEKIDYNWDLPDFYFDEVFARKAPGEENDPNLKSK